jgi:hypothetical protein
MTLCRSALQAMPSTISVTRAAAISKIASGRLTAGNAMSVAV